MPGEETPLKSWTNLSKALRGGTLTTNSNAWLSECVMDSQNIVRVSKGTPSIYDNRAKSKSVLVIHLHVHIHMYSHTSP